MVCDLIDFRCIIVNELIGSAILTVLLATLCYFLIAGKLKWGFDTTVYAIIPVILILGLAFTGFSAVYAFTTFIVGLMLAWLFNKIIGN